MDIFWGEKLADVFKSAMIHTTNLPLTSSSTFHRERNWKLYQAEGKNHQGPPSGQPCRGKSWVPLASFCGFTTWQIPQAGWREIFSGFICFGFAQVVKVAQYFCCGNTALIFFWKNLSFKNSENVQIFLCLTLSHWYRSCCFFKVPPQIDTPLALKSGPSILALKSIQANDLGYGPSFLWCQHHLC